MTLLRAALVLLLLAVGALLGAAPASASAASGCPTETFLRFNHLAYEAVSAPATVTITAGSSVGTGEVDEPTTSNGCKRVEKSAEIKAVGTLDPRVAVVASGLPRTVFVIGHRCSGFTGTAYWDCLLHPLVFGGRQFTATSYPTTPAPQKKLPFGSALGKAQYQGHAVTVRRIAGVDPTLAVGISGQPSEALLTPRTCPYSGFSNVATYDDLLRCLRSPVWFTFDPPGSLAGGTVTGRSDRTLAPAVAGAAISLIQLPVVADLVPANHGPLVPIGHVAEQVNIKVPHLPSGLYEAVVTCPRCTSAGSGTLFPAGSILVTAKPKTSVAIQIISYALAIAVVLGAFIAYRTYRRRRAAAAGGGDGGGANGSGPARS